MDSNKAILKLLWRNWLARSAVNRKVGGSNPPKSVAFLAQLVERPPSKRKVMSSNLIEGITNF